MKIVFAGSIGRSGLGGQAWANLQYLIGLRELGQDVYYLEDCGETSWVYNWKAGEWTDDSLYPANYVRDCLEPFGFGDRWMYRAGDRCYGMPSEKLREICAAADLLVMRAIPIWTWRPEYSLPARRVFIDVDPGFTQLNIASGDVGLGCAIGRCEKLFTIGQNIGEAGYRIPTNNWTWQKTFPPIALSAWPKIPGGSHFTSVMRWDGFQDSNYDGAHYGQKEMEFPKFFSLPGRTGQSFQLALNGPELPAEYGWQTVPGEKASRTPGSYQQFIQQSRAEFGVAKHGYVQAQSGWLSDRTVCYLASGKPVLIQGTGLRTEFLNGKGFVVFHQLEEAIRGVDAINKNYEEHSRAARQLAEEHFASDKVLTRFLENALE